MKTVNINGVEAKDCNHLHQQLKVALDLPGYYGANSDALWDCLTTYLLMPVTIKWVNFEMSVKNLGECASSIAFVIKEAQKETDGLYVELTDGTR